MPHVLEAVLNDVSGHKAGNRAFYAAEKRARSSAGRRRPPHSASRFEAPEGRQALREPKARGRAQKPLWHSASGEAPAGVDLPAADWRTKTDAGVFSFDGKSYPYTGNPAYDASSYKQVNASTFESTRTKAGKVVQTVTIVVSADGKSRTVTTTGVDEKGQQINNVAVYDKQ